MRYSKTQQAFTVIKQKIIRGELPPNADVFEQTLQEELCISRTPVREALQLLQKEGFVNIYPNKGIIVTDVSIELLSEIYDTRIIVEPYVVRSAFGKIPEAFLRDLRNKFSNVPEGMSEEEKVDYFADLDKQFHTSQLQYFPNRFLREVLEVIYDHEERAKRLSFDRQRNEECSVEHIEMIDDFLNSNLEALLAHAVRHVELARDNRFRFFVPSYQTMISRGAGAGTLFR